MNDIQQRLQHIRWLKSIGIQYYCSTAKKDSKNLLIEAINAQNAKKIEQVNISSKPSVEKNVNFTSEQTIQHGIQNSVKLSEEIMPKKKNKIEIAKIDNYQQIARARSLADSANDLDDLYQKLQNFDGCALKEFAATTVFADGSRDAEILLIGEAPGAKEDEIGIPFCGESGILLDAMLKTIGISRETNAYITNTIFWRPPANRRPTVDEVEICRPFVEKHIALKKPKLIILVGGTATTYLLGENRLLAKPASGSKMLGDFGAQDRNVFNIHEDPSTKSTTQIAAEVGLRKKSAESISEIRQNSYLYTNQYLQEPVYTTALFHPAYLLRQPMQKKSTWYDLLKIKNLLTKLKIQI